MNDVLLYLLALATRRYPVQVHAFCVLSNHLHLVVTDVEGRLPAAATSFARSSPPSSASAGGPIGVPMRAPRAQLASGTSPVPCGPIHTTLPSSHVSQSGASPFTSRWPPWTQSR